MICLRYDLKNIIAMSWDCTYLHLMPRIAYREEGVKLFRNFSWLRWIFVESSLAMRIHVTIATRSDKCCCHVGIRRSSRKLVFSDYCYLGTTIVDVYSNSRAGRTRKYTTRWGPVNCMTCEAQRNTSGTSLPLSFFPRTLPKHRLESINR